MGVKVRCCSEPRMVLVRGKRRLRSLFWRVTADIKRQIKACSSNNNKKKKNKFKFNYDPFSYSLNFDDGNFGFFCSASHLRN